MEINIKGHSGCNINISRKNGELFILKSTSDPQYINRLRAQVEKQINAYNSNITDFKIPKIYDIENTSSKLNIYMEYIYSMSFIEYFERCSPQNISNFIHSIISYIELQIDKSKISEISTNLFIDKFNDVKSKIIKNNFISEKLEINKILNVSQSIFEQLPNIIKLPIGICHGDLTFSNILFCGDKYYLIDFLDSFIESPIIDIVKIRQDSAYNWSTLMYSKKYDKIRLNIITKHIDNEISSYFKKYDWYNQYYHIFQLMNFLRILQYTKKHDIAKFLISTCKQLINEIQFNNPNCGRL